jgi:hypothetical protein
MLRDISQEPNTQAPRSVRCTAVLVSALMIAGGCRSGEPDRPAAPIADAPTAEVAPMSMMSLARLPNLVAAAIVPDPPDDEDDEDTEVEAIEPLKPAEAADEIAKLKKGKKGKALHEHLGARGFKPGQDPQKDLFGQRTKYKDPDRPQVKFTHTIVLQNYHKEGSKDEGAIATVTLVSKGEDGTETTTYDFSLVAPDGKFDAPIEYTADEQGAVVEAQSWYSCLTQRITQKCGDVCKAAIFTCAYTTWVGYLGCLAISCGGCLTLCTACCSCDCSWWCKWGVGCCDR